MQKIKTLPLIAAMTLLFVFAIAACTTEETADLPPYPDLSFFDTEAAMADTGSTAWSTSTRAIDSSEITLEQVLRRTRSAVSEIDSYKSRGTTMWRSSTTTFEKPHKDFIERASNGNYRVVSESPNSHNDTVHLSEWRSVGNQVFHRNSNQDWEESMEPLSEPRTVTQAAENFLWMLDSDEIQLRSSDERNEDGTWVYRLEYTEQQEMAVRDGHKIMTLTTTLLVSQESFRIIGLLSDNRQEIYLVSTANEIGPETHSRWSEAVSTTEYYDFNEPVVIEVPDEYVSWSQPVAAVQTP